MDLLENYVTNITKERVTVFGETKMYELTCDIMDCFGYERKQEHVILSEEDYNMVKEKGYYLA